MTLPITQKGLEFAVSTFSVPTVTFPASLSIAGLANGATVVAWQDGPDVGAQLFDANGAAASNEFHPSLSVGPNETLSDENVVALANGNFVVTWNDNVVAGGNTFVTVDAQIYDPNLNKIGGQIAVIPQFQLTTPFYTGGDVFATPDGGFAYAESINQQEIVQAFHADGSKNGAAHPNGGPAAFPRILAATALTNGNYVTLMGNQDSFWVYDKSGNQVVGQTLVAGATPQFGDIAALPDGRFVIVYDSQPGGGHMIGAQIYNPDGSTFGNQIAVNGALNSSFDGPHVSAMPDGRFIVSWYDTSGDAGNFLTEVRVFNPDGTAATNVFAIPGSTEAADSNGFFICNDVTALGNNSFSVDWKTGATIEGQVFSVPGPTIAAGTTADLILRETSGANTGQLDVFDLGNNAILAAAPLGGLQLNWQVMGIGGFAGIANEADMIVRDSSTGNLEFFDIAGNQFAGSGSIGSIGTEWQTFGVGNFSDNVNETDMVIHNTNNGGLFFLDIQHNQIVSLGSMGSIGAEWQSLGAGDFSSIPGETDIIMRNTQNGGLFFLDIQHNQLVGMGSIGGIGLEWQALGVGNVSGNANESDLIMRDSQNGAVYAFDIQHNQISGITAMGTIGAEWQALGVGDVSGVAGETDLVMRDTQNGAIFAFDIQHNQFVGTHLMGAVGTEWQNLGIGNPLIPGSPLV